VPSINKENIMSQKQQVCSHKTIGLEFSQEHPLISKMTNMVRLSSMPASPRSGIAHLMSDEPKCFSGSRCVSPGLSEMNDNRAQPETIQQTIQHVDAVLDLMKLGNDDMSGVYYPFCGKEVQHGRFPQHEESKGIQLDSGKVGQTAKIRGGVVPDTHPAFTLVDILREGWTVPGASRLARHNIVDVDDVHNTQLASLNSSQAFPTNKMPSRPLHHGESKRYSRQGMEAEDPSRPCGVRRNRSRAIAIKRSVRDENFDEIRDSTAAAEYDWATWRMYNRIIDHRQKYPLNYQHEDGSAGTTASTWKHGMNGSHPSLLQDSNMNIASTPAFAHHIQDYPEYGEVFELDL
jgi:hypothetical protein